MLISKIRPFVAPFFSAIVGMAFSPIIGWLLEDKYSSATDVVIIVLSVSTCVMIGTIAFIGHLFEKIKEDTTQISNRIRSTVELLPYGPQEKHKNPFEVPINLIDNAKDEILILDYFPWPGKPEFASKLAYVKENYQKYFVALIRAAERKVEYHRIVQLPEGASISIMGNLFEISIVKNHFRKMMEMMNAKEYQETVSLKSIAPVYPTTTFIIIDRKYVIWEIPYIKNGDFRFDLDLLIDDSNGDLVNAMRRIFSGLGNSGTPIKKIS